MIRQIWLRIAALLAFAVIPIVILQLKLQEDSMSLVFNLADNTGVRETIDGYLSHLREDARKDPGSETLYKEKFTDVSESKKALEAFFYARDPIYKDIRLQTLAFSLIVLVISLFGSFMISRGIVKRAQQLMQEKEKAANKLRDLHALENWQNVAKILVHELRAPMTPIKLVVSDLDYKRKTLSPDAFDQYLIEAQALMNEQVASIEMMIEGFTAFGKLPAPSFQDISLPEFLRNFVSTYGQSFGHGVGLAFQYQGGAEYKHRIDPKLIRDLLFNLCKNAAEANANKTQISIRLELSHSSSTIAIHNTGKPIPSALADTLFDPYVTSKNGSNMGLGLAISRKIALDHKGDLSLANSSDGVTFILDLPRIGAHDDNPSPG